MRCGLPTAAARLAARARAAPFKAVASSWPSTRRRGKAGRHRAISSPWTPSAGNVSTDPEQIRALQREIRELRHLILGLAEWTTISSTTSSGDDEGVAPSDGNEENKRSARRIEPFGFRSRPPSGIRSLIVKALAGAAHALIVGTASSKYGPADLKEGETCLFSMAGCTIKLNEDGEIIMTGKAGQSITLDKDGNIALKAAAGKNITIDSGGPLGSVIVNRGTTPVIRAEASGDLAGTYPMAPGALNFLA